MTSRAVADRTKTLRHKHLTEPNSGRQQFGFSVLESDTGCWYGVFHIRHLNSEGKTIFDWSSAPFMLLARIGRMNRVEALNEAARDWRAWMQLNGGRA